MITGAERRARIVCLDLDTFFVSVERLLDPSLEGQPVVVGGRPGERGVVTACSYEVRAVGVRSGMPLRDAGRLAPHAIYLPVRHDTYGRYAAEVRRIAARFAPEIEVASIDEMYMSFAGCEGLYHRSDDRDGDATIERTVRELTGAIRGELGLPSSAGIAATRSMAKVASGLAKPAGVVLVPVGREAEVLAPLPVRKLPGVGPVAEQGLHALGIDTVGELARRPVAELRPVFGAWAEAMKRTALGDGAAELGPERPAFREHDVDGETVGSISNERTFEEDARDPGVVEGMLCSLVERVAWRARKRGVVGRTVTLKLRYAGFQTLTRAFSFGHPTAQEPELLEATLELLRTHRDPRRRVRLLGVQLSKLELARQLDLLPTRATRGGRPVRPRLGPAVDGIRDRFGYDAVRIATGARSTQNSSMRVPPPENNAISPPESPAKKKVGSHRTSGKIWSTVPPPSSRGMS